MGKNGRGQTIGFRPFACTKVVSFKCWVIMPVIHKNIL